MRLAERPLLALTCGEPAGVGPDISVAILERDLDADVVLIGDYGTLQARASSAIDLPPYAADRRANFSMLDVPLARPATPGKPETGNADAVLKTLRLSGDMACAGLVDGVVSAPVAKNVLAAGEPDFVGHTEYYAKLAGVACPVMMFVGPRLKVAFASTHTPLSNVEAVITLELICEILRIANREVRTLLGIAHPKWKVCALNPHAGEGGMFGDAERTTIEPAIEQAKQAGIDATGPHSADTVFLPANIDRDTCILSMYHDQALPVIKRDNFAETVNVTLGLPFVRTSVDHGTAFELAATGEADPTPLLSAINLAARMVAAKKSTAA